MQQSQTERRTEAMSEGDNPTPPRRFFKDADDNEWTLKIDTAIADDLKSEGLIDIDDFETNPDQVLMKLVDGNRTWLPKVLCVCLDEQRQKKQIEKIKFDGESLDKGAEQLQHALIDFFPFTKRPALRAALDKSAKAQTLCVEKAIQVLDGDEIQTAMENKLETEIKKVLKTIGE